MATRSLFYSSELDVSDAVVTNWDSGLKNWVPVSAPTGIPLGH